MDSWEQSLEQLLDSKCIGIYQYCQVDQIVIVDETTNVAWNYFIHVHFSKKYISEMESEFLCSPKTIDKNFKLYISRYCMNKEKFRECIRSAITKGIWNYTDSKAKNTHQIDDAFPTAIKFVAENDPTGSYYNNVIPLEKSLYGSNFNGNYYIFEIYASGEHLKKKLCEKELNQIQAVLHKCGLNYRLDELFDRIGNVVCKFDIETLNAIPKQLGKCGTVYAFELTPEVTDNMELHLHIEQEHDRLIYKYVDETFCLHPGEKIERGVEANQCKTTLTISDVASQMILFRTVANQSVYSNYYGQITLDHIVAPSAHQYRKIKVDGKEYSVALNGVKMIGELSFLREMSGAGIRQQKWKDNFFKEQKYLLCYKKGEHDKAISDIRKIINEQLPWDLEEIKIVDPYLSAKDILNTVAFCGKKGVRVCCLTSIHAISHNKKAKTEILTDDIQDSTFEKKRNSFKKQLEEGLGRETDLRLSFRTVYGNNGSSFHDRYLILKYQLNKIRVWSLGTSVNSVGKSHHIIQIVESPILIDNYFDEVWKQTDTDECKIYDYADYNISSIEFKENKRENY